MTGAYQVPTLVFFKSQGHLAPSQKNMRTQVKTVKLLVKMFFI